MAKKRHKSVEMTSEEDGVEVIEAAGRPRTVAGRVLEEIEGEGHQFDELEMESDESDLDSDSDAFEELDAEFEELDDYDESEDVVDEDAVDEVDDDAVDAIGDREVDDEDEDEEGVVAKVDEVDKTDEADEAAEVEGVGGGDSDDLDDDALIDDDASGWLPDPDNAEQERFWDGTEWTDQVRAVDEQGFRGRQHLPDHVPELQRALAAATADIDDVEARLSTLFDRGKRAGAAPTPPAPAVAAGAPIHEEFGGRGGGDASSDDRAHPKYMGEEGVGEASGNDDDEATFAELDAALVAETPEKPDRRFFKRRS